jgi:hypothetical protein
MLSETLLISAVKEIIAELVSKTNKCDYCFTYYKSFMVDVGLTSPDTIAADYQTAAILDADKKSSGLFGKGDTPCLQNYRHRCGWAQGMWMVGRAGSRRSTLVVELFSDINRWGSVTKMIELVAS